MKLVNNEVELNIELFKDTYHPPEWFDQFNYFAVDEDGEVWGYSNKPEYNEVEGTWNPTNYLEDSFEDFGMVNPWDTNNVAILFTRKQLIL